MSVELSPPSTLGFPRPLTQLVKRSLLIHNPHPSPLAFKVKTTAPRQYTVRPNSGRIEAGESVEIQILLQPLPNEPPPHAKCKDKFLVQSAFIKPDEEMRTLAEMWSETERTNKSAIQEQKIKCAYIAAEDGSTGQNGIPEENEDAPNSGEQSRFMDESQLYTAAPSSPTHATPPQATPPSNNTQTSGISLPSMGAPLSSLNNTKEITQEAQTPPKQTIPSLTAADIEGLGPSPTNIALEQSLVSSTSDSDKLSIALREIDKLRNQLAEAQGPQVTGLRRRGTAGDAKNGAETVVEKAKEVVAGSNGVPLEVVVGVAVGVFVLTYLFF